jgi:hypothetical protein
MKKDQKFSSRNIRVEIRMPRDHVRDLEDEFDYANAMKDLFREWLMVQEDVNAFFKVIKVEPPAAKPELPE